MKPYWNTGHHQSPRRDHDDIEGGDRLGRHHFSQQDENQQSQTMWYNGDEFGIELGTVESPSSDTDATEDEVLDDAPPEILATLDAVPDFGSNVGFLEDSLDNIMNTRDTAPRGYTVQAWLRQRQREAGQATAYDQWVEEHHGLRVKDFSLWEESQRRLLEELEAGLYSKYCEVERVMAEVQRESEIQEKQQQQAQHSEPLRQPEHIPQPAEPTEPTHIEKLSALLSRTTSLMDALSNAKELTIQQELRSALDECRQSRTLEIKTFFATLLTTIDSAAAKVETFLRQAHNREQTRGCLQWLASVETEFCAAWECVVEAYHEVWQLERALAFRMMEQERAARNDWEKYLVALAWFGERVTEFGEGSW
ncbi:hypothetical protein N657DRAFT_671132 [Parathielavia appendiculata]|uniref:Uncharacterized protein n=1 Tax=Parathielavia appendiculata TaxID=2587402 RepID=A0AAN6U0R1_9PEZI|nr:hypothetical protein N657DRAFT_671132 [Parathielavia appendiculata]